MGKLNTKDLISIADLSVHEVESILNLAFDLKAQRKRKVTQKLLHGKTLAMIFEKPSNRTRVSFDIAMYQLYGHTVNLTMSEVQLGRRESIPDVARTLSRYMDGILIRTFDHESVVELARSASVPVINGLTDLLHPCQALSDIFTIQEKKGPLNKIKLAYIGDGNNVCHSLMLAAAKTGMQMKVATPKKYRPKSEISRLTENYVEVIENPHEAVSDADVIYTDVWASMGKEKEKKSRIKNFKKYQVNSDLLKQAKKNAIVMHCLPAHRGEEITNEIFESKQSVVFDQAENRLHVQKAILYLLLSESKK